MSSVGVAPRAAVSISNSRAEASRRNGAKSRGPKTSEGKARSARNALKHGLRAQKYVVLPEEDGAAFEALETALFEELAPQGTLQAALARRVAVAAWRLARADRLEVEVFEMRGYGGASPGVALIRDGNGTRSIETLLRYRGATMAELTRALRTLKALQAETRADAAAEAETPVRPRVVAPAPGDRPATRQKQPNEPKSRENPRKSGRAGGPANPSGAPLETAASPGRVRPSPQPRPTPGALGLHAQPIEPETRHPEASAPRSIANA